MKKLLVVLACLFIHPLVHANPGDICYYEGKQANVFITLPTGKAASSFPVHGKFSVVGSIVRIDFCSSYRYPFSKYCIKFPNGNCENNTLSLSGPEGLQLTGTLDNGRITLTGKNDRGETFAIIN